MKAWGDCFEMPLPGRSAKVNGKRSVGITMVIDKGLGLNATRDLMANASHCIDCLKLTFGTSAFLEEGLLREKIGIVRDAGVDIYPGGTFLEVAVAQGTYGKYLKRAKELGFGALEISDGTIQMDDETRRSVIKQALDSGFKVISEVGKKDPKEEIAIAKMQEEIASDLEMGVFKVIVEARESGHGVGIFDASGNVEVSELDQIISGVKDVNDIIWEAPLKNQQLYLILRFGVNVNLGNVPPDDILALEALRNGLRGDTLKVALDRRG
ncbi:MAG: phosphosulfolactate synthase [Bacteroidetes bacterium]|nr:phosphosulfolactate synthase [Bacteroidota bacterium]MCL5025785.1 phosphosulfolactate synthase [Chloroflexota bacterium]